MESSAQSTKPRYLEFAGLSWLAVLFLLLTAAVSLIWSHFRLMDQDEFLVLWTDRVYTLGQLIHIQRNCPISLDPLFYHVLAHLSISIFGATAFAIRLPSLLGYLLMQVCLYKFVRRIATERAAIFALAFPALTATLFYSVDGRPYGLLLGEYALAMLYWQTATRDETHRFVALVTLALTVALTLNTHYFGILLLVPLCAAELYRTIARRRLDLPVLAAIAAGMAGFISTLPFVKAAAVFRKNYYNTGVVNHHTITQAYRSLLVDYTHVSMRMQHVLAIVFVLFTLLFLFGCIRQLRNRMLPLANSETVFLIVLAALPFCGFLMAHYATHTIEVRYVLGAIVGITPLLAIALTPIFRRDTTARIIFALLFIAIAASGIAHIYSERSYKLETLASLVPSSELKAAVLTSPTQALYIQDMGHFAVASFYEPDPVVRSHLALVYSPVEEIRWRSRDTNSLTALNMKSFTQFTIAPYESLTTQPGDHIFLLYHDGWNWTDQAFAVDHAQVTPIGKMLQGDTAAVRFLP